MRYNETLTLIAASANDCSQATTTSYMASLIFFSCSDVASSTCVNIFSYVKGTVFGKASLASTSGGVCGGSVIYTLKASMYVSHWGRVDRFAEIEEHHQKHFIQLAHASLNTTFRKRMLSKFCGSWPHRTWNYTTNEKTISTHLLLFTWVIV